MALGWCISIASGLAVLYGVWPYNQVYGPEEDIPVMNMTETFFYNMFQRVVWSAALAWIILACHWGFGGNII